jgi:hypothetical protein
MSAIWATDRPPIELQDRERPAQQPGIRGVIKLVLQCASGRALIGKSCIAVPSEQTEETSCKYYVKEFMTTCLVIPSTLRSRPATITS